MGMEVRDACTDKEPDGVIIYSTEASPGVIYENTPTHSDGLESAEHGKPFPVHEEYDLKECTTDNSADNSEVCEEQQCPVMPIHSGLSEEEIKAQSMKAKGETRSKVSPKIASKPCSTNGRANCTVPQPFALATEKRASSRPSEAESDVNKLSLKSKTTTSPTSVKKIQVFFLIEYIFFFDFSFH